MVMDVPKVCGDVVSEETRVEDEFLEEIVGRKRTPAITAARCAVGPTP